MGPFASQGPSPGLSMPFGSIPGSVCAHWVHPHLWVHPRLCLCPLGPSVSPTLCPLGPSPVLSVPIGSIPGSVCAHWVHPPLSVSQCQCPPAALCAPRLPPRPPRSPRSPGRPAAAPQSPHSAEPSAPPRGSPRAALRSAPLRSALLFRRSVASRPQRSPVCTARRVRAPTVGDDVQ